MRLHLSILSVLLLGACGLSSSRSSEEEGRGRVALSWTLDGAFFTAERCKAENIAFMEVEVQAATGPGQVGFSQIQCDLDKYSLTMTPLGRVILRVSAMGKDTAGMPCLRRYGEAATTATTSYPQAPTRVELKGVVNCR